MVAAGAARRRRGVSAAAAVGATMFICPCLPSIGGGGAPEPKERLLRLNVGGVEFCELEDLLTSCGSPVIAEVLEDGPEEDGTYFLDRDGELFEWVLDFLRDGPEHFVPPDGRREKERLLAEAKTLGIDALVEHLAPGHSQRSAAVENGYQGAPKPTNEAERLARLQGLNILHTKAEHTFDSITRIVAAILDVPICLISLVDEDKQWFKAKQGLNVCSTSRNSSFCSFLLTPEAPKNASMMVIEDALCDSRFADNPLVVGEPKIRFYAGSPLVTSDGLRLGSLCAIDRVPRALTPQQAQVLVNFSQLTVQAIEAHQLRGIEVNLDDLDLGGPGGVDFAAGALRTMRMKEAVDEIVLLVWAVADSLDWPILYANQAWTDLTGVTVTPPARFPGPTKVEESGIEKATSKETGSLWDYLWLNNEGVDDILSLWQHIAFHSDNSGAGAHPFAKTVVLAPRLVRGAADVKVSCRFMPSDLPLDVGAAAIRSSSQYATEGWQRIRPQRLPVGNLYFVTITPMAERPPMPERAPPPERPLNMRSKVSVEPIPEEDETEIEKELEEHRLGEQRARRPRVSMHKFISVTSSSDSEQVALRSPYPDVRLLRVLERGEFGLIHFGTWVGASVAVKCLTLHCPENDLTILSTDVAHLNIAQTYFFDTQVDEVVQESKVWLVREWCDGGNLAAFCKGPRLEGKGLMELVEICSETCSALDYMHSQHISHGNLTPKNLLLKSHSCWKGFICKVSDFGMCVIRRQPRLRQSAFCSTASNVGDGPATRPYDVMAPHIPPEDVVSERASTNMPAFRPAGDIFALGMVMYQIAAGEAPTSWLPGKELPADLAGANDRGRWLRLPAKAPQSLNFLYMRCIAANPAHRPTAHGMMTELHQLREQLCTPQNQDNAASYRRVGTAPVKSKRVARSRSVFSSNTGTLTRGAYTPPGTVGGTAFMH